MNTHSYTPQIAAILEARFHVESAAFLRNPPDEPRTQLGDAIDAFFDSQPAVPNVIYELTFQLSDLWTLWDEVFHGGGDWRRVVELPLMDPFSEIGLVRQQQRRLAIAVWKEAPRIIEKHRGGLRGSVDGFLAHRPDLPGDVCGLIRHVARPFA